MAEQVARRGLLTNTTTLLILLLYTTLPPISATAPPPDSRRPFRKIYAFGDSYTDTGNTVSTTGPSGFNYVSSPPYGMTFFHRPTNRYSDGRLVIDFVAESLSLPFLPPYKKASRSSSSAAAAPHGVNFAVAGSTAIPHAYFAKHNMSFDITPESLGTQLEWFNEYLDEQGCREGGECEGVLKDALVWVGEIGANDYAYSFASSVPPTTIQNLSLTIISRFLQAILKRGAKSVVIQGLPPTGCLPLSLSLATEDDGKDALGCVASVNRLIRNHNARLQAELQRLTKQNPDATIVYADYWDAYAAVLQNPSHYGIKERFKVCCGTGGGPYNFTPFVSCGSPSASACDRPSEYVNWDGVHLTEAMYEAVSHRFLYGPSCHPPFQDLLSMSMKHRRAG